MRTTLRRPRFPTVELVIAAIAALALGGCREGGEPPAEPLAGDPGYDISIEYERVDAGTGEEPRAFFEAEIEGLALRDAWLRLPDGSVLPFVPTTPDPGEPSPLFLIEAEDGEAALLARFPPGIYTIDATLENGQPLAIALTVSESFPDYPDIIEPADGALDVPVDPRFVWAGPDAGYDVTVVDDATGAEIEAADALEAFEVLCPEPLAPATAYRLELSSESTEEEGRVEFESTRVTRFTTAP